MCTNLDKAIAKYATGRNTHYKLIGPLLCKPSDLDRLLRVNTFFDGLCCHSFERDPVEALLSFLKSPLRLGLSIVA